jgi:predicted component of type VI protein secretion system
VLTAQVDPLPSVLVKGRRAVIGRGADVDVRIPDPSVSPHHATIIKRGEAYLLIDEGSRHGTGVVAAGRREPVWLAPDSPRVIEEGERIFIGQIELEAHLEAAPRGAKTGYEELAPHLVRAGLTAAGLLATDELVESTLDELTSLPEEILPEDDDVPAASKVGVAALAEDDRNPPWITDLMVAGIALAILAGCALGLYSVLRLTA